MAPNLFPIELCKMSSLSSVSLGMGRVICTLMLLLISSEARSMDNKQLLKFVTHSMKNLTGDEPVIYRYNDEGCGSSSAVLVKRIDMGSRIGVITFDGLCWGAFVSYFEMTRNNPSSIRLISQISSGRSEHFENWSPTTPPKRPSKSQMRAIAEKISQ